MVKLRCSLLSILLRFELRGAMAHYEPFPTFCAFIGAEEKCTEASGTDEGQYRSHSAVVEVFGGMKLEAQAPPTNGHLQVQLPRVRGFR